MMMMRPGVRGLGQALTLVAVLATNSALAGPGGVVRPFKWGAQSLVTGVEADGALVLESVGNSTSLGKFTKLEFLYVDNLPAIRGAAVFTAANGDRVFAEFEGGFTSPTDAEGVYTITGGTGRFAGATGTVPFEASAQDLSSPITLTFSGTIRF